jgi:hypothetical protein
VKNTRTGGISTNRGARQFIVSEEKSWMNKDVSNLLSHDDFKTNKIKSLDWWNNEDNNTPLHNRPKTEDSSHWSEAWMLVGDVYAEYHRLNDHQEQVIQKQKSHAEVRMSNEVAMEVKCLKRKLGKDTQNCGTCSLINCSCQSDRVVAAVIAAVVLRPLQSMVERKIKKNTQTETFIHNLEIMRSSMHTKLRKGLKWSQYPMTMSIIAIMKQKICQEILMGFLLNLTRVGSY